MPAACCGPAGGGASAPPGPRAIMLSKYITPAPNTLKYTRMNGQQRGRDGGSSQR